MRQPAPAARQDLLLDRLEDLAAATAALRKALSPGRSRRHRDLLLDARPAAAAAPLADDDEDEIRATPWASSRTASGSASTNAEEVPAAAGRGRRTANRSGGKGPLSAP